MQTKKLYRSETDVIIGGVAGGLGEYFELDPALIRVIFIFLTLAGGSGVLLYLILWLLLPAKSKVNQGISTKETLEQNARDMEEKAKQTIKKIQDEDQKNSKPVSAEKPSRNPSSWLGFGLITIGGLLLLQNLNIISSGMFWPLMLVFIGFAVLIKSD